MKLRARSSETTRNKFFKQQKIYKRYPKIPQEMRSRLKMYLQLHHLRGEGKRVIEMKGIFMNTSLNLNRLHQQFLMHTTS